MTATKGTGSRNRLERCTRAEVLVKPLIKEHACLHVVTAYPNKGDRWKELAGRARERACLDREKIPCGGSGSLKSSAKKKLLSSPAQT